MSFQINEHPIFKNLLKDFIHADKADSFRILRKCLAVQSAILLRLSGQYLLNRNEDDLEVLINEESDLAVHLKNYFFVIDDPIFLALKMINNKHEDLFHCLEYSFLMNYE